MLAEPLPMVPEARQARLIADAQDARALDETLRALGIETAGGPGEVGGPVRVDVDDRDAPRALLVGAGAEGNERALAMLSPDAAGRGVRLSTVGDTDEPTAVCLLTYEYALGLLEELLSLTAEENGADARAQRATDALAQWRHEAEGAW